MAFNNTQEIMDALNDGYEVVYFFEVGKEYEKHRRLFYDENNVLMYKSGNAKQPAEIASDVWHLDFKNYPNEFSCGNMIRNHNQNKPPRFVNSLRDQDCKCTKCGDAIFMAGASQPNFVCYTCRNR